jgi:YegS/Rv2252/BmrU family lipid kinase
MPPHRFSSRASAFSRTRAIVNPAADGGDAPRKWTRLQRRLEAAGDGARRFETRHTSTPRHATRLTRQALRDGCDRILAVGGDGTFGEVVDGFFAEDGGPPINPEAVFTPVACGTGEDFRRTTGAPGEPVAAVAHRLRRADVRRVDVGRACFTTDADRTDADRTDADRRRTRHFLNVASLGMGADVSRRVHASNAPAWVSGRLRFLWAIVRVIRDYRCRPVTLTVDGQPAGCYRMRSLAVANGRFYGGGLEIAPRAALDDGRLDAIVVGDFSLIRFPHYMRKLYAGAHLPLDKVAAFRGETLTAESPDVVPLDLDGEPVGRLPATFEVLPGVLHLQH